MRRFNVAIEKQSNFSDLQELVEEAYKYDDIIFGDFRDSPLNISLKTIMEYKWLDDHCDLDFGFHFDTDFMINPFRLLDFIEKKVKR